MHHSLFFFLNARLANQLEAFLVWIAIWVILAFGFEAGSSFHLEFTVGLEAEERTFTTSNRSVFVKFHLIKLDWIIRDVVLEFYLFPDFCSFFICHDFKLNVVLFTVSILPNCDDLLQVIVILFKPGCDLEVHFPLVHYVIALDGLLS